MFNSTILDVIIGLVFCFASVALFVSSINEGIASLMKLRHNTLLRGIQQLLNDPTGLDLAKDLYQHALINPMTLVVSAPAAGSASTSGVVAPVPAPSPGAAPALAKQPPVTPAPRTAIVKAASVPAWRGSAQIPAYIESMDFAHALTDVLKARAGAADLSDAVAKIDDQQLRQVLQGFLTRAGTDLSKFDNAVADWFDHAMSRLSGSYKRHLQLWTFVAGLVVAGALNIDAFYLLEQLWARPGLASAIGAPHATELIKAYHPGTSASPNPKSASGLIQSTAHSPKPPVESSPESEAGSAALPSQPASTPGTALASVPDDKSQPTSAPAAALASSQPANDVLSTLEKLPIGWGSGRKYPDLPTALNAKTTASATAANDEKTGSADSAALWPFIRFYLFFAAGLLVTASSALFGAPFWFDLLQRLIQIRGTGAKPPTNRDQNKASVTSPATP
jgi:hypothetical protein